MKMRSDITLVRLRDLLRYDEDTGLFYWKIRINPSRGVGEVAGSPASEGYISIGIDRTKYKAHRLAWFYTYGVWPSGQIDHIDGNTGNNALANLRDATPSENQRNSARGRRNTSGFKGVSYSNRWRCFRAMAKFKGKMLFLGNFETAEDASLAYRKFASENHGEFIHPSIRVPEAPRSNAETL